MRLTPEQETALYDQPDGDDYPFPDTRHVLIVEPGGMTYIAPHAWPANDDCRRLAEAFAAFEVRVQMPDLDGRELPPAVGVDGVPGRWWCDTDTDGNFLIGGRVQS